MLSTIGTVDLPRLLLDLLEILVAAKLFAELAERLRVPAVLGEIVAGIIIGPSVLGLVELGGDRGVSVGLLAELGVLLLLLTVGMEMDLGELRRVGGPALSVAVIGVALPFVAGIGVGLAFGLSTNTSIFFGAALTATSVGITARVFGDLRALASTEARIVLGAAVADDVLGLVVLTVVTKLVTGGEVGVGLVAETVGLAVLFLAATALVGSLAVPRLFDGLARRATSQATVAVAAMALMLGFALLADVANLAFIIGAFMAGLALGQTRQHERIATDLGAVGNLLIPVFFVSIGINADLSAMTDPGVLGLAAALTAVAVVGKVLAGWGVFGRPADRLLIGLGMIPRGEVGLIFAAIGLSTGVLDDEQYGALLIVILVTTLITPPLLRVRLGRSQPAAGEVVDDDEGVVARALEVAASSAHTAPSDEQLDWFAERRDRVLHWTSTDTPGLLAVLRTREPRAMRLLEATGVLDRALPEVAAAMARRRNDLTDLDPVGGLRFPTVERVLSSASVDVPASDSAVLAAFVADVADDDVSARSLAARLTPDGDHLVHLLADARLLRRRGLDPASYDETEVLQFATHMATSEHVDTARRLAHALADADATRDAGIDALGEQIAAAIDGSVLAGGETTSIVAGRREAAERMSDEPNVIDRIRHTPAAHVLAHDTETLVRHARLVEPLPRPGVVRVAVSPLPEPDLWRIDIACRDTSGLLARLADGLLEHALDIEAADIGSWPDGGVVDSFVVRSGARPSAAELATTFEQRWGGRVRAAPLPGLRLSVDNHSLPWHTLCTVEGPDRFGVFRAIAHAFAAAGVVVHHARLLTADETVTVRLQATDRFQRKLDDRAVAAVRAALTPR